MKEMLLATSLFVALATPAYASVIVATFGQTSQNDTVVATNPTTSTTHIGITNAVVDLTQFLNGPLSGLDFNLSADSIDQATTLAGSAIQHFNGNFCISTGPLCTGTDVLSGVFSDAAFGALTGPGLVVNVNNPPDTLTLSSAVLSPSQLLAPSSFGLTFTSLTPGLSLTGPDASHQTISAFDAGFSGNVSASPLAVPEPGGLAVLGIGILGLLAVPRRSRREG